MSLDRATINRIFGLKLRFYREEKKLTSAALAEEAGLSSSYLNEVEKGKKYPKPEKIDALAQALGIDYDTLIAQKGPPELEPVIEFLQMDLVRFIPEKILEVDYSKFFDFVAQADHGISAFFNTINRIVKSYKLSKEHFIQTLLHSHVKLRHNYFNEIEEEASQFRATKMAPHTTGPITNADLEKLLLELYSVKVERSTLAKKVELSGVHSYFSTKKKTLFLNSGLTPAEESYLLTYEIAFREMQMSRSQFANPLYRIDSFDELYNHFRAKYFAGALLLDEETVYEGMRKVFEKKKWVPGSLVALAVENNVPPELLMNRWANLIHERFGIDNMFLIKINSYNGYENFDMNDTLNFFHLYEPIVYEKNEHFCRRWISINIVKRLKEEMNPDIVIDDAQKSEYWRSSDIYLCFSIAQKDMLESNGKEGFSFTLGLQINEKLRGHLRFLNDDINLKKKQVYTTCEQCGLNPCGEEAAKRKSAPKEDNSQQIEIALRKL